MTEKEMELYYQHLEEELAEYDSRVSEMAKVIFNTCAWRFGNPNDYKELFRDIAEDLVKLNYCKIPEGSVVLPPRRHILASKVYSNATLKSLKKEDLIEHIRILQHNWASAEECLDNQAKNFETLLQQARKETAKEISTNMGLLQESLNKKIEQLKEPFRQDMNSKQKEGYKEGILVAKSIVSSFKYNISKQFDLEVAE